MSELREGTWDPSRVMYALGKIGYSNAAAILDIVDNSVSWNASKVDIDVATETEHREGRGRRRSTVSSITISDNGTGMDDAGLDNALCLGSSSDTYAEGTLSKFGLGLKSAASSLGRRLTVTSRMENASARTAILDHDTIAREKRFVYLIRDADDAELERLDAIAGPQGSGTIVKVDKIHEQGMEPPAEVVRTLEKRAGVIYFFALQESEGPSLELTIDGSMVTASDPLFGSEADIGGDLDERSWDGLRTQWIQRRQAFQLTEDGSITAFVSITQLPHPPSVGADEASDLTQAQARSRYGIGAGNYGFYIFRNGRLINWAESLGMVPQDQDLYAFRGRIEITDAADEALNINVAKNRIQLSDVAANQLTPILREAIKKSRLAWGSAKAELDRKLGQSPHDAINEELNEVDEVDEESDRLDEESAPESERVKLTERRKRTTERHQASPEEAERLREQGHRVQHVPMLPNNQLWERAHDPQHGLIVRVNGGHRLVRDIVDALPNNGPLMQVVDILLYGLARTEYAMVYKSEFDENLVEAVMDEFRERAGSEVSEILRRINLSTVTGE